MKIKIGLDGMGGDNIPYTPVKAAILAGDKNNLEIVISGDENKIKPFLSSKECPHISLVHCDKYVLMEEKVSLKLLKEKENSMRKILSLLKEKQVDCAISAGNTAVFVSLAISELGILPGIERPAIAVILPNISDNVSIFLDVGANISPKPLHLFQYGIMGSIYAENVFGIKEPKVGLLNIGEEESKGDDLRRETFKLFSQNKVVNFIGNIEGQELFLGKADVIVSDGFTGNVCLKVSEGVTRGFKTILRREISKNLFGKIGYLFLKNNFKNFSKKADYAEYGGGILLGVNGIVIISHGRSSPRAILSAIKLGEDIIEKNFLEILKNKLKILNN